MQIDAFQNKVKKDLCHRLLNIYQNHLEFELGFKYTY